MSITDWILATTALILLWYAYETRNLRKIMCDQLNVMNKQLANEVSFLKPFFRPRFEGSRNNVSNFSLHNTGGAAMSIRAVASNGIRISVSTADYLGTGEVMELVIEGQGVDQGGITLPFNIECLDRAGNFHRLNHIFESPNRVVYQGETN